MAAEYNEQLFDLEKLEYLEMLREMQFLYFYDRYPRKKAQKKCFQAWIEKHIDENLFRNIIDKLSERKNCDPVWIKEIKQSDFEKIPYAQDYICGELWKDESWKGAYKNVNTN